MKSACLLCAIILAATLTALPQTSPTPPTTKKTKAKPASKTAAATKKVSTTSKSSRKPGASTVGYRSQQAPTPDRYREIQQALAEKGYLKNEPNGVWDQQSSDALKQFQTENNLSPTGKLSSRSLIQLGLGPKPPDPIAIVPAGPVELPPQPAPLPLPEN